MVSRVVLDLGARFQFRMNPVQTKNPLACWTVIPFSVQYANHSQRRNTEHAY